MVWPSIKGTHSSSKNHYSISTLETFKKFSSHYQPNIFSFTNISSFVHGNIIEGIHKGVSDHQKVSLETK